MSNDDYSMKVFVGSIDFNVTEKEIEDAFKPYGEVTNTIILRDRETNKSRGFGFVTFKNKESVKNAIDGMNQKAIRGRPIIVNFASKKSTSGGGAVGATNKQNAYPDQQTQGYGAYAQQQQQYYNQYGGWNPASYAAAWNQGQGYWPQAYGQWGQQGWGQQQAGSQAGMGSNGYPNQQYGNQQYNNMNYGGNSGGY